MQGPGFLTGNAPLGADVNLVLQLLLGALIAAGAWHARRVRYRLHGAWQGALFATLVTLVGVWMAPAFHSIWLPALDTRTGPGLAVVVHVALGTLTLALGAYVILVATTSLVPRRWRFGHFRPWMRALFACWWITLALGALVYWLAWIPR